MIPTHAPATSAIRDDAHVVLSGATLPPGLSLERIELVSRTIMTGHSHFRNSRSENIGVFIRTDAISGYAKKRSGLNPDPLTKMNKFIPSLQQHHPARQTLQPLQQLQVRPGQFPDLPQVDACANCDRPYRYRRESNAQR